MASVNKVTILGNVGQDPELRYTPNGDTVCNLSLATSRSWKDKTSGEKQEETEWHRASFFGRLAEIVGEYVKKGHPLYIEGRLKTRKWTDKEGVEKYTTEIIVSEMQLLGGRDGAAAPQQSQQRSQPPARQASVPQRAAAQAPKSQTGFDDMDDDIPF